MKQDTKKYIFTNSVGDQFELYPMNPLEEQIVREQMRREWAEAGKPLPDKPTYTVTTAAGDTESIRVNSAEEAESVGLTKEWSAYKAADSAFEQEYGERYLISCYACIKGNPDDYPEWKKRLKIKRIPIPEDESDKTILFGQTWVIRSTDDITGLIIACAKTMTNMSDEAAAAAEARFRLEMERTVTRIAGAE